MSLISRNTFTVKAMHCKTNMRVMERIKIRTTGRQERVNKQTFQSQEDVHGGIETNQNTIEYSSCREYCMFKYHLALEAMIQTSIMYSYKVGCVLFMFQC